MIIAIALAMTLLIPFIPLNHVLADWTIPNDIVVIDSTGASTIAYFANSYGYGQVTNLFYVEGHANTIAYCIDAEAEGPGGTSYTMNDSAIDATYRDGLARISQAGYPNAGWASYGISDTEAQYATQAAIHWWENTIFGGTEGWVRSNGVVNNGCPTNFDGTLAFADWLLSRATTSTSPDLYVSIDPRPTTWSTDATPTSTFGVLGHDTDYWTITLPAGVTIAGLNTYTGSGDATVTAYLTDPAAFAASSKVVTAEGFSNRTEDQIHYYINGAGYQNLVVYQQNVSGVTDPDTAPFPDATTNVTLLKIGSDTLAGVAGAHIQVYRAADRSNIYTEGNTDADGGFALSGLADGTYYWAESAAPVGYNLDTTLHSFSVSAGTVSGTVLMTDSKQPDVTLTKTDGITGLAGTALTVWTDAAHTNRYLQGITDSSGTLTLPDVPDGTYYWAETAASSGYVPDYSGHTFSVTGGVVSGVIAMSNLPTTVTLGKLDRVTSEPLSGAHFVVRNASGQISAEGDTNAQGQVTFTKLPVGTYSFAETKAPDGYLLNPDACSFAVGSDGSITGDTIISNVRQQIRLTLTKEKESAVWNDDAEDFEWNIVPAQGITFTVYAAADIKDHAGNVIFTKDEPIDTIITDAEGIAVTDADLYYGSYYARETAATEDVVMDRDTVYPLTIMQQNQTDGIATFAFHDGKPIVNREIAGTMDIYKLAADTQLPMAGVVFDVYDMDKNLVDTVITDSSGHARTKVLPYGDYTLLETKTTIGYALTEKQSFRIYMTPYPGEWISEAEMTVADEKMAQIEVYKVTADGQVPMDGVVYGVYAAADNRELARITTDVKGYGSVYLLPGNYYLQEISTWDGYAVSPEKIEIENASFAEVYTFRETNQLSELRVHKQSTDGTALPGMEFVITENATGKQIQLVYDEVRNAYVAARVLGAARENTTPITNAYLTDMDGNALVLGLKQGTYTITETKAPDGYNLDSSPVTVTIAPDTGGVLGARIVLRDSALVTKTGESGNPALYWTAGFFCLAAASVIIIIRMKRRRISDE